MLNKPQVRVLLALSAVALALSCVLGWVTTGTSAMMVPLAISIGLSAIVILFYRPTKAGVKSSPPPPQE
jgi:hypothetical protein